VKDLITATGSVGLTIFILVITILGCSFIGVSAYCLWRYYRRRDEQDMNVPQTNQRGLCHEERGEPAVGPYDWCLTNRPEAGKT